MRKIVIASGVVTTLAGSGSYGSNDATGIAATFASPAGIVFDGANLYVAEWNNHKIRKIVISTGDVTTLAGSGTSGAADATGAAASFFLPQGIASDGSNLYVMDKGNHKIRKVGIIGGVVSTLAGSELGFSVDATGTAATFFYPAGMVSDGSNLYVADGFNHKIRKIVIATGVVTTLAGSGAYGSADGTGPAATFAYPAGLAVNGGDLYVADTSNHKIRKIVIASGAVTTLAGSGTAGAVNATGAAASFNYPRGLSSDGTNLYVADTDSHKIRKIVISTGDVTTLAGSGIAGAVDAIISTAASFNYPAGLAIEGTNLYVADSASHKIRKIVIASGVVTTIAGSGTAGSVNATGTSASFLGPGGITSDGTNLYVTDQGNHKIRKIVLASGVVSTWAGTGSAGVVDGTGATASFFYPSGISAVGSSLYVTESGGHTLRKIQ
ncbi:MAG: hypothetical protein B7Y56_02790 [Gallionellales bacterium 35-53-114]|nr:MAG: hypothetical protein B7Y56_02790 [Gallionellales bacterium 35-53-114]OYZ64584.1 MAG: hypothetical protein B7Y04_06570 [Gallionellales bacterium 24-53-125]OZB10654.1 MAG: hypothetical protein B7X61_01140 [Gallionellales bacterium 39-52-133]